MSVNVLGMGLLGATGGGGLWLLIDGLVPRQRAPWTLPSRLRRWLAARQAPSLRVITLAVVAALAVGALTRWTAAGVAVLVAVVIARRVADDLRSPARAIATVDGVAGWTEMLRDTMAGGGSLADAIATTAPLAPAAIRSAVMELAARLSARPRATGAGGGASLGAVLGYQRNVFVDFADAIADPLCDLVVNELIAAAQGEATQLNNRLSALAATARDEANLRRTVHAERAEARGSALYVIGGTVGAFLFFFAFARDFVAAYDTARGQVVLLVVMALTAGGVVSFARVASSGAPERHFPPRRAREDVP